LLAPILGVLAVVGVWSNHFENTFQDDDFHVIVNNRAIQDAENIPHFFKTPQLYADQAELAQYRPVALLSFALDSWLARPLNARLFNLDSFLWFFIELLLFAGLCGLIPGADRGSVLLAVALFAVHPLTGETLNYASHRGDIIGAIAVVAGLCWRIVWPSRMPREILRFDGVPTSAWLDFRRRWSPRVSAFYRKSIDAPLGLYLIPVIFGLFADPGVAVFPLLLLAYIILFDRRPQTATWRRVLPSAVVCGGFWVVQLAFTWKYAVGFRRPTIAYWITQPWVILRYLWTFLVPVHLTAGSDLLVFPHFWSPLALAGFVGLAGLIALALRLGKSENWRAVSFGLWWFLITLLPSCVVPQRLVEADSRMYLPLLGLSLATARAAWLFYQRRVAASPHRLATTVAAVLLALVALGTLSRLTYRRTEVWGSPDAFWHDVTEKSPRNGRAFIELGAVMNTNGQPTQGWADLQHAVSLISTDAPDQIRLARAFDSASRDKETEAHFLLATQDEPNYAPAWSAYAQWLVAHQRLQEGFDAAMRALKLRPWSLEARHTLMDYYSAVSDWDNLRKIAQETLLLDPTDPDARRSIAVAQAAFEEVRIAEQKVQQDPSVDGYLTLSTRYYRIRRYEDSIEACNKALQERPQLAEAYSNMAAAYYALGKVDQAIAALKESIRIRPDLDVPRRNLDFLLALKGQPLSSSQPAKH
jgi:tetratricopeptide (TPR) repeat protein